MDTWATSSLTPQIAGRAGEDPELYELVFPMDLRPQAHDIIRTWLFTTVLRSELDEGRLPWSDVAISGWVLDPDRKKMSKSKGNVVTPMHLLEEHGADAVRYWAASGRPGTDTAFESQQMKVGRKLAVKLLNASKFALSDLAVPGARARGAARPGDDRAHLARSPPRPARASRATTTRARCSTPRSCSGGTATTTSSWSRGVATPTDADVAAGVSRALRISLSCFQRLFAPFLPFVCEEVWSWWQEGSIHRAPWPDAAELAEEAGAEASRARSWRSASLPTCCATCARPSPTRSGRCGRR